MSELDILDRAYRLFAGTVSASRVQAPINHQFNTVGGQDNYRRAVDISQRALKAAAQTDTALASVIAAAARDHAAAQTRTRQVLDAARTDPGPLSDSPVAQREALRRRAARLRAQHEHVSAARRRAARRLALVRLLRYRALRRRAARSGRLRLPPSTSRAGIAVRAALSRLGRPYVWGATGPDQFDCSGLVQWSYRQAGISLDRTTYDQINDGIAVPRSQVRPGDLVFPHSGHVQMAIGNGMVVEAPHAGANVQISPLGHNVTIRRPLP